MKSEKIILQCNPDELDKFDLALHSERNVFSFDLLPRDASLHHQWRHVDPCRFGAFNREPRQCALGPRLRSDPVGNRILHQIRNPNGGSNEKPTIKARACVSIALTAIVATHRQNVPAGQVDWTASTRPAWVISASANGPFHDVLGLLKT